MSQQIEIGSSPAPQAVIRLSDATPDELAHDRYLDALHDLVQDAAAGQRLHLLADVLAWTFARLAINCGPAATADLLAKVGKYMGRWRSRTRPGANSSALGTRGGCRTEVFPRSSLGSAGRFGAAQARLPSIAQAGAN